MDDVRALWSADFPKLNYLGLRDSEIVDELAKEIGTSPLLDQIKILDLSLGTMTDEGGKALLECEKIKNLQKLDLHRHYLSEGVAQQLAAPPSTSMSAKRKAPTKSIATSRSGNNRLSSGLQTRARGYRRLLIRLGFVSRRFPDYVPQTTSSISISLPERN